MLTELRLRNVAVIESVSLPLGAGLNVLTGETGAGKSLIVGALGLLLGERGGADRIRAGADRATVEALFDVSARPEIAGWLDEHGVDTAEHDLVLKREVLTTGRSRAWVNGSPVTVALLRELGALLVVVHGQHEAQTLLDASAQRDLLDAFASASEERSGVADAHDRVLAARRQLASLAERQREVARRADYLRMMVQEIDSASLKPGDDVAAESEHRRLAHAEELRDTATDASSRLQGEELSAITQLDHVRRALSSLQRIDPSVEQLLPTFESAYVALEEVARELSAYAEGMETDPERLRQLEVRRTVLHQLQRKFGPTVEEVLHAASEARKELALVDDAETAVQSLKRELSHAEEERNAAAAQLTKKRTRGADSLGTGVSTLLPALGMLHGRFRIELVPHEEIGVTGAEGVHFLVALNLGNAEGPLNRIASGGELARVMLSLSVVLASTQPTGTLVFDEVDAGVGGAVAWQVGAMMRQVAEHHQVLAISHLAQIAACAHQHVVIAKSDSAGAHGVTTADTVLVTGETRVGELARMLGGDADGEVGRAHARELLDRGAAVARAPAAPEQASTRTRQRRGKPG